MFEALTSNAVAQIEVVESLIARHEALQEGLEAPARQNIKLYAVSSCVTRLYAIYENFVHQIVSDYLDAIPELQTFGGLAEGFRKEYRIGISYLLGRLDHARYAHLKHENVITWYHQAITNASPYRFVTEALTRHEENLRLSVVESLLTRVQLPELRGWVSHHADVLAMFAEPEGVYEQLESELRNFVQLRNDAAHGTVVDLLGTEAQLRLCSLVRSLVLAISSYVYRCLVLLRAQAGKARRVGRVSEVFPKAGAFVAQLTSGSLEAGMSVHLLGNGHCEAHVIESLQIEGDQVQGVSTLQELIEVGVKIGILPKRNAEIYADC